MGPTNYDFGGYATKNDLRCSDGRVIRSGAFKHCDGKTVPLVWNHLYDDPSNVLGHAVLQHREDGVYAYGYFNDTENAQTVKELVKHGDILNLSIFANQLRQDKSDVLHGEIREVSLVHAGANPGAIIDEWVAHSDDSENAGFIYVAEQIDSEQNETEELQHSDTKNKEDSEMSAEEKKESEKASEKTVEDVLNSLTEEQHDVVMALVGQALEEGSKSEDDEEDNEDMKHNAFENEQQDSMELKHSAMQAAVMKDWKTIGSMKESFLQHKAEYGIENIEYLFPDAQKLANEPGFIKKTPDEWVGIVMNGVHHTPFSRIKMVFADITADEARAKGYTKGKRKIEEVFSLLKRTVSPTTVYKKQKLDRDDIIDITDFDVVAWLKGEMRMMLDEELARAFVFGDGRTALSDDKINEQNIIPVVNDDALYTVKVPVTVPSGETLESTIIDTAVLAQDDYDGSGNITMFMKNNFVTKLLLIKDKNGRRIYNTLNDLALAMNVNRLVKVPASIVPNGMYAVALDLKDYNVGADKGGAVNMFDDFDIDYNRQKYLIETRCSGALVKPKAAFVLTEESADQQAAG